LKKGRRSYIPDRGDFVWLTLAPTRGRGQSGRRPAVVISPKAYNGKTGLCIVCPATTKQKGYAFEVVLDSPSGEVSVVLSDHVRSLDWRTRKVELIRRLDTQTLDDIIGRLLALIDPQ
jgi:mRNA interferase MazF